MDNSLTESNANTDAVVLIDGSYGEGGGQIIRNAVTYCCLLRRKIQVTNIRANRPNPGLASQHLESIRAIMRISGASAGLKEPKKKGVEFDLDGTTGPKTSSSPGVNTTIDLITAGSCTLCIQCILPFLLSLKSPSKLKIIGGTHVLKSPSFDYFQKVFLPIFNKIMRGNKSNALVQAHLQRPGYFPRGGGCVELKVGINLGKFQPFTLTERGPLKGIQAVLSVPSIMKGEIPEFKNLISETTKEIEVRDLNFAEIEILLQFENSYAGFSHLVEGKRPGSHQLMKGIKRVLDEVKGFLASSAALDSFMQDQLIIYMALAKSTDPTKTSTIRTIQPTDHTLSAIHVSQLFSPLYRFEVCQNADSTYDISL